MRLGRLDSDSKREVSFMKPTPYETLVGLASRLSSVEMVDDLDEKDTATISTVVNANVEVLDLARHVGPRLLCALAVRRFIFC